jgi:hypothetical protein
LELSQKFLNHFFLKERAGLSQAKHSLSVGHSTPNTGKSIEDTSFYGKETAIEEIMKIVFETIMKLALSS